MNNIDFESLAHVGVQTLSPYQTGGFAPAKTLSGDDSLIIKLASNENPLGCSTKAKQATKDGVNYLSTYPDGDGRQLKAALSDKYDISENQITLGAGSENIIHMLVQTFNRRHSEILFPEYSFIAYKICAQALNSAFREVQSPNFTFNIKDIIQNVSDKTSLVFIANPNNPTGTYLNSNQLTHLLECLPKTTLVVIDEAYYEFAKLLKDYPDTLQLQAKHPNLVVLRTFSKAYGLAGLRVGYAISHPDIASLLNRVRLPFNTTQLAQDAATAALADEEFIQRTIINNQQQLMKLIIALQELNIPFIPSCANFLAVEFGEQTQAFFDFATENQVMLRPLAPYNMPNHLRISIGSPEQNDKVIKLIQTFFQELSS